MIKTFPKVWVFLSFIFSGVLNSTGQVFSEFDELIGGTANSGFASRIAVHASTAVVSCEGCGTSGQVIVYEQDGAVWQAVATLTPATPETGGSFGRSVDIFNDVIAVGNAANRVYVFEKPASGWSSGTEDAVLTFSVSNTSTGERVKISENYILAMINGPTNPANNGVAAFEKPSGPWVSTSSAVRIARPFGTSSTQFGRGLTAFGDTIMVASAEGDNPAYLYFKPPGGWGGSVIFTPDVTLEASVSMNVSNVSSFVSLNELHAYVGVEGSPVHIYQRPSSGWNSLSGSSKSEDFLLSASVGASSLYGASLALVADSTLVVGDPSNNAVDIFFKGANGLWSSKTADEVVSATNSVVGDQFGIAVGLDSDLDLLIGANQSDRNSLTNTGSFYYFLGPLGVGPSFSGFSSPVATVAQGAQVEIAFSSLLSSSDATDPDGTVDGFRVHALVSGTLKIGTDAASATPFVVGTNDLIDASNNAYWTADNGVVGTGVDAFSVVAVDNSGNESTTAVNLAIDVTAFDLLLNELLINVTDVSDATNEYIEFRGTPGSVVPSGIYFLAFSGDRNAGAGRVFLVFDLSGLVIGSNGQLVLAQNGNGYNIDPGATTVLSNSSFWGGLAQDDFAFRNDSYSFLLVSAPLAPRDDLNYDPDFDGILSGDAANWSIIDGVGKIDGSEVSDIGYAPINFSVNGIGISVNTIETITGFEAYYFARNGNSTGFSAADWVIASVPGTAAANFTLGAGKTIPSVFEGQLLNHLGSENPAQINWIGVSNDWASPTNWDKGTVPGSIDYVAVSDVGQSPVITTNEEVYNLELATGASISISSGASLAIYEDFSGAGIIGADRDTQGSAGYSMIGSPIAGKNTSELNADFLYSYNGTTQTFEVPTGPMIPGEGFFVGYNAVSPTVSLHGTPNTGNVAVTIPADEFKILSNPYLAPISYAAFDAAAGSTNGNIWLWDDGGANTGADRFGDYVTVNSLGVTAATNGNTGNIFSGSIASFQGFFVKGGISGGNFIFTPSMQDLVNGNGDNSHFRIADDVQKVKLALTGNGYYNEIIVAYTGTATFELDRGMDAEKFSGNEYFAFYSMQAANRLAIQALPQLAHESTVKLGYELAEAGNYSIGLVESSMTDRISISLFDTRTGDLRDLTSEDMHFTVENAESSDDRFQLIVALESVLNIEEDLSGFKVHGNRNQLKLWDDSLSGTTEVAIYNLQGKEVFKDLVEFFDGEAQLKTSLRENQLYVLKANGQRVKFLIK